MLEKFVKIVIGLSLVTTALLRTPKTGITAACSTEWETSLAKNYY
jgi:hypothetical protein